MNCRGIGDGRGTGSRAHPPAPSLPSFTSATRTLSNDSPPDTTREASRPPLNRHIRRTDRPWRESPRLSAVDHRRSPIKNLDVPFRSQTGANPSGIARVTHQRARVAHLHAYSRGTRGNTSARKQGWGDGRHRQPLGCFRKTTRAHLIAERQVGVRAARHVSSEVAVVLMKSFVRHGWPMDHARHCGCEAALDLPGGALDHARVRPRLGNGDCFPLQRNKMKVSVEKLGLPKTELP